MPGDNANEPAVPAAPDAPADQPAAEVPAYDELLQRLESLEKLKDTDNVNAALSSLRRLLEKPPVLFNSFEALEHLEYLVSTARKTGAEKLNEYEAILEECRSRVNIVEPRVFQGLLVGLIGDPASAKAAREASALIKAMSKEFEAEIQQPFSGQSRGRFRPYGRRCFNCNRFGHIRRFCNFKPQESKKD